MREVLAVFGRVRQKVVLERRGPYVTVVWYEHRLRRERSWPAAEEPLARAWAERFADQRSQPPAAASADELARLAQVPVLRTWGGERSWVYVFLRRDTREVKIGLATDVCRRLCEIQAAHGEPIEVVLVMPGGLEKERELHRRWARYRKLGEWFYAAPEIVDWIIERRHGGVAGAENGEVLSA